MSNATETTSCLGKRGQREDSELIGSVDRLRKHLPMVVETLARIFESNITGAEEAAIMQLVKQVMRGKGNSMANNAKVENHLMANNAIIQEKLKKHLLQLKEKYAHIPRDNHLSNEQKSLLLKSLKERMAGLEQRLKEMGLDTDNKRATEDSAALEAKREKLKQQLMEIKKKIEHIANSDNVPEMTKNFHLNNLKARKEDIEGRLKEMEMDTVKQTSTEAVSYKNKTKTTTEDSAALEAKREKLKQQLMEIKKKTEHIANSDNVPEMTKNFHLNNLKARKEDIEGRLKEMEMDTVKQTSTEISKNPINKKEVLLKQLSLIKQKYTDIQGNTQIPGEKKSAYLRHLMARRADIEYQLKDLAASVNASNKLRSQKEVLLQQLSQIKQKYAELQKNGDIPDEKKRLNLRHLMAKKQAIENILNSNAVKNTEEDSENPVNKESLILEFQEIKKKLTNLERSDLPPREKENVINRLMARKEVVVGQLRAMGPGHSSRKPAEVSERPRILVSGWKSPTPKGPFMTKMEKKGSIEGTRHRMLNISAKSGGNSDEMTKKGKKMAEKMANYGGAQREMTKKGKKMAEKMAKFGGMREGMTKKEMKMAEKSAKSGSPSEEKSKKEQKKDEKMAAKDDKKKEKAEAKAAKAAKKAAKQDKKARKG